jgi:transposase
MQECPRCKELELKIEQLESKILELEKLIKSLVKNDDDDDDSSISSSSDYFSKMKKKKKPGKEFGKNKKKKSRGAKKGHKGHGRAKCDVVDREVDLALENCPACSSSVTESKKPITYVQEDLEIKKVATLYTVHQYTCDSCHTEVKPEHEIGFIGKTAKSLSILLHYYSGIPFNKIGEMFEWFGLNVSDGSLALWGKKMSKKFSGFYDDLKNSLNKSSYLNVDETGWPINGKNHWMWVFRAPHAVMYKIDASRGSAVVKDVISEDYEGVLTSDFYSAYNPISCIKQKCHVHLLREVRDWDKSESFEKRSFYNCLHRIFSQAKGLSLHKESLSPDIYSDKVSKFIGDFNELLDTKFSDKDCTRLMKRLCKHNDSLWTFLKKDVPYHNNAAELAIRRTVINRKVSCGNRSDNGARVQEILLSAIQTAKMQGMNLLYTLLKPSKLSLDFA